MHATVGLVACLGLVLGQDDKKKDAEPAPSKELKELHAKLEGKWVLKRVESAMGESETFRPL